MTRVGCFSGLLAGKKKKSKDSIKSAEAKRIYCLVDLPVKPEEFSYSCVEKEKEEDRDSLGVKPTEKSPPEKMGNEKDENSPKTDLAFEAAYEGGDEHDDNFSFKREFSDFDLQALVAECSEFKIHDLKQESSSNVMENNFGSSRGITPDVIQSGHISDPGMGRTTDFCGSPMLKRSCSNIETKRSSVLLKAATKSSSCDDLQNYSENVNIEVTQDINGSPLSVITSCSADKVMLKKRSSSQVLPSRSKKLWWRLFLWSHRNLHQSGSANSLKVIHMSNNSNQKGGYCSDTVEPSCVVDKKKKKAMEESEIMSENIWPQKQWVAFSADSSSLDRVGAWVHSLDNSPFCPIDEDVPLGTPDEAFCSTEIGECSSKNNKNNGRRVLEDIMEANTIIQSLNSLSAVAHIAGMGLKVIPPIAPFTSLRSVNLSGNFIGHITPGSLPKSLHTLDLSRNKIATVEGLRELTRLRVLNLSYNRISRIGHGLSNCTVLKQLYLAGNKISDVEGLHRLLKLTVLDLSFNKITTAKALGQLVANYNSLLALNLLGNPIQSNIGDEQLRKAVSSLLPSLAFLNKQPIKPQRAREVASDSIAKAALGNSSWGSRRKLARRSSQGSTGSVKGSTRRGLNNVALTENGRHKSKGRHQSSSSRK